MRLRIVLLFLAGVFGCRSAMAQDFIRLGLGGNFKKNAFIQTFSFDLNRTEKVDEKAGRFLLFNRKGFYVLPTADVNLGEGVTASENNVLTQVNLGKAFYGPLKRSADNLRIATVNKALEFNPSFNTNKDFSEKLYYGQFKAILNPMAQYFTGTNPATDYLKKVASLSVGAMSNIGYRRSANLDTGAFYMVAGGFAEGKMRFFKGYNDPLETWVLKVTGTYYRIIREVPGLTPKEGAGLLKASIDRNVVKTFYIGLTYKYGNDTPQYAEVHTLEFSLKIRY